MYICYILYMCMCKVILYNLYIIKSLKMFKSSPMINYQEKYTFDCKKKKARFITFINKIN